jgi:RNA polymerase sigma-70 factor (ECF subfamily)
LRLPMSTGADTPTVEEVWHELHDQLLGFISRRVRRPEDADDILQEVMLRIHRHGADLEGVDHVTSWVYRITSNAIVDYYRKPARRELPSGEATDIPEPVATAPPAVGAEPDAAELRAELSGCLRPFTARLPESYREAIELTEFQGISQVEAAGRLGLSVSGMKTRVQRGRGQLKDLLLDCCHVELDTRGGVADYRSKRGSCGTCGR